MQVGNAGLRDVAQVSAGSVEEGRSAGAGRMLMDVMCAVMVVWLVCG